ncbi:DUF992 domain-containing protein [Pararhizobium sp.]|uniref:DUF992 domain-containing protein n=1 Tax=Pararhizobium sp. TaxID=1977563 RepID=UPI00272592B0|nr:DUF992 domain-containing protein [Pararhizobium sp.]MDO9416880.1 DUF992 domain-containing protein [Pararhizobium sp.]
MNTTTLITAASAFCMLGATGALAADMVSREPAPSYDIEGGVKIGTLACDVGGGVGYVFGSAKTLGCTFTPIGDRGSVETYSGAIRKMGVDIGFTTRGRLVWSVFAPTAGLHSGSLAGLYEGITAEATLGGGVGANILVGGTSGSIQLQTLSVTGQLGLNLAATGTSVTLTPES